MSWPQATPGANSSAVDRAKGWLDRIPGYTGYQEREAARDTDRAVRTEVARELGAAIATLEVAGRKLAAEGNIREVSAIEAVLVRLRTLVGKVQTADTGFTGAFREDGVSTAAIEQLVAFDAALMEKAAAIKALAANAAPSTGAITTDELSAAIETMLAGLGARDNVLRTAKPVDAAIAAPFLGPVLAAPAGGSMVDQPVWGISQGDALTVLGADYVADARINIETPDRRMRLFRLGRDPERWLAVPVDQRQNLLLLQPAEGAMPSPTGWMVGSSSYTPEWTISGRGELAGPGGSQPARDLQLTLLSGGGADAPYALALDWGNEKQVMTGRAITPADLKVFGTPAR